MTSRTRTQITIHTRKTIVVRPLGESFPAWWEQCLEVVPALTRKPSPVFCNYQPALLNDLLIGGELHAVAVGGRSPLICCNSLSANPTETQIEIEGERQ
jgi:hypothetical protein